MAAYTRRSARKCAACWAGVGLVRLALSLTFGWERVVDVLTRLEGNERDEDSGDSGGERFWAGIVIIFRVVSASMYRHEVLVVIIYNEGRIMELRCRGERWVVQSRSHLVKIIDQSEYNFAGEFLTL